MQLISADKRILVIGSLNANPADRAISRDNIRSMQVIDENQQILPLNYFNSWGELGMSSLCWHESRPLYHLPGFQ
jgi:hypothetical protein